MGSARSSYRVRGLDNDVQGQVTSYVFIIHAVNAKGAGPSTHEAEARPRSRGGELPGMPRNVTARANNDGSVTLRWTRPVSNGGSSITDYEYLADPDATTDTGNGYCGECEWASTETTGSSVTITHRNGNGPDRGEQLQNGQLYAFAVRAVNAKGRSSVSNRAWATVQGAEEEVQGDGGGQQSPPEVTLTASLDNAPASHNGEDTFSVRIAFSEDIATSLDDIADGFAVSGGSITFVSRVNGQSDLWEFTIQPSGDADVTLTLAGGRACSVSGAPCTDDGRTLSGTLIVTVAGPEEEETTTPPPPPALTARVDDFPVRHDGQSQFAVRIAFSAPIRTSYRYVDDAASANGPVRFTLSGGGTCGANTPTVICTSDGRALSNSVSIDILGP